VIIFERFLIWKIYLIKISFQPYAEVFANASFRFKTYLTIIFRSPKFTAFSPK